ncbi:MAG: metallophosphoesterase [Paludibacteraceae bacterium]|nr:metallophosphoesterase [Paludibacteraceae bacterium]
MKIKKIIIGTVMFVLLGVMASVCAVRWRAWFGNPPEAPYQVPAVPDRVMLSMSPSHSQAWRRVSWRCDTIAREASVEVIDCLMNDTVFYVAKGTSVSSRSGQQMYYQVDFPVEEGRFLYRVHNDSLCSSYYAFEVDNDGEWTVLLFGDLQDEVAHPFATMLQEAIKLHPEVDMCAFTGDIVERPTDEYWNIWFASVAPIVGKVPIVACPGNHEHVKAWKRTLDQRFVATFGESVVEGSHGNAHYEWDNMTWSSLNTDVSFHIDELFRQKQTMLREGWIHRNGKWNVLMMHHPFFPAAIERHTYIIREVFEPMVKEMGVHLVLNGHDHVYARRVDKKNNLPVVPIYMVCNSSEKHYLANCDTGFDRIACGHRMYSLLRVTKDTLHILTYLADTHVLYDEVLCRRAGDTILVEDNKPQLEELLDVASRYEKPSKNKQRQQFLKKKAQRR